MKKGLGKGLDLLFHDEISPDLQDSDSVVELKITEVEPNQNQPRKSFDPEKLALLAESSKEHGLIQPIVVTKGKNGFYTIVAGERRWRAAKKAGLETIPVMIHDYTDQTVAEIALIENLQREDLNPIEEANGYHTLIHNFHMTQEEISQKIGKSRSAIANSLRLLTLEDELQQAVINGEITEGHARAILSVNGFVPREFLKNQIIEHSLNVRQAEQLAKDLQKEKPVREKKRNDAYQIELDRIQSKLDAGFATKVKIMQGAKKGKIEIEYYGNDDLERILSLFNI